MVDITVQGAAVRRAVAERARIEIRSRCTEDAPGAAMQRATEAHARAVAEVRSLETAGAVDTWSADRAWVQHHEEWVGEGRRPRLRFTASATVTARFRDLDAMGALIGALGSREEHELGAAEWSLTDETVRALARDARAAAVADALERARDYATAAGLDEPRLESLREPGASPAPVQPHARAMATMAMPAAEASVELSPGQLEVRAAVDATFSAAPAPGAGAGAE